MFGTYYQLYGCKKVKKAAGGDDAGEDDFKEAS